MAIPNVLRNINCVVDGRGYAGRVSELTLPKLSVKTEEHEAGGFDAPIELDMGMEKLEAMFTLRSVEQDVLRSWGLRQGQLVPLTFRGALQSEADGAVTQATAKLRGLLREVDFGSWKPREAAELKCTLAVRYYALEIGGVALVEIDVENMIRVVDGVDQLAAQRAALGV